MKHIHRSWCAFLALTCACVMAFPMPARSQAARNYIQLAQEAAPVARNLAPVVLTILPAAYGTVEVTALATAGGLLATGWVALPIMAVGALVIAIVLPSPDPPPLRLDLNTFPYPPGYFDEVPMLLIMPDGSMVWKNEEGGVKPVDRVLDITPSFMFDLKGNLGVPLAQDAFPSLDMHDWLIDPQENFEILAYLDSKAQKSSSAVKEAEKDEGAKEETDDENELVVRYGIWSLSIRSDWLEMAFLSLTSTDQTRLGDNYFRLNELVKKLTRIYQQSPSDEFGRRRVMGDIIETSRQIRMQTKFLVESDLAVNTLWYELENFERAIENFPPEKPNPHEYVKASVDYFWIRLQLFTKMMVWATVGADEETVGVMHRWLGEVTAIYNDIRSSQGPPWVLLAKVNEVWAPALLKVTEKTESRVPFECDTLNRLLEEYISFVRPYVR